MPTGTTPRRSPSPAQRHPQLALAGNQARRGAPGVGAGSSPPGHAGADCSDARRPGDRPLPGRHAQVQAPAQTRGRCRRRGRAPLPGSTADRRCWAAVSPGSARCSAPPGRTPRRRVPPDLARRDFTADRPSALRLVEFTYARTWSGRRSPAFVSDACSRRIVGWRTAASLPTQLPLDALEMALWTRVRAGSSAARRLDKRRAYPTRTRARCSGLVTADHSAAAAQAASSRTCAVRRLRRRASGRVQTSSRVTCSATRGGPVRPGPPLARADARAGEQRHIG